MDALNTLAKLYIAKEILVFALIVLSALSPLYLPRLFILIGDISNKISDKMARK